MESFLVSFDIADLVAYGLWMALAWIVSYVDSIKYLLLVFMEKYDVSVGLGKMIQRRATFTSNLSIHQSFY